MSDDLRSQALNYHRLPVAGKLAITATKPMTTQRDLALAYSPGVAAACEAIVESPEEARSVTARGNLVGVVTMAPPCSGSARSARSRPSR